MQSIIEEKLQIFDPEHLEVLNESFMHNVPEGSELHFKVTIVSKIFENKMLVTRHRLVNECLSCKLFEKLHALALHTMTPDEWFEKAGYSLDSPLCMGGR